MGFFSGIHVAIVTPLTDTFAIDDEKLRAHANWLIEEGVHGLVPSGTCGEYAVLADDERARVVEAVIQAAAGRVPVTVGVASPATEKAVYWGKHAKANGASAIMALPTINYKPTKKELFTYYEALNEVGLPIIAYNNTHDTATDLTPDLLKELSEIPNFVAVKEFSGDVRRIPEILEKTNLEVLAGADDLSLEGLLAGATGWVAGLTNAVPGLSVAMFNHAKAGRVEEARTIYRRVLPLFRYDSTPRLVQAIKYAMQLVGHPVGTTRPPRLPLEDWECRAIEAAVANVGVEMSLAPTKE